MITNIFTNNISEAKDYLIRIAIKLGLQYIDIDNEVHIEGKIFRFYVEQELINSVIELPEINIDPIQTNEFIPKLIDINKIKFVDDELPKFNKKSYKEESRKVKTIIKKRGIK